ncbi:beta-1 adrenergic receptor-like isoform X1 [Oculina patagonica]
MASTTSMIGGIAPNVSTSAFAATETSEDEDITSLSPLVIGLILEGGILAVMLGNLLVLVSLKFQKHWLITDFLLLSLSTADFIGGAFPLQLVVFMNYFVQQNWTASLCGVYIVVVNSLRFASAGTVTLMAVERAFMILSPFKYHTTLTTSRVKKLVVFTWLNAVFFGSLPFMGVGKSGYEDGKCFYHLTDLGKTYAILIVSASFLLLALVLACYIAIKSSSSQFVKRQTTMDVKNKSAGTDLSRGSDPEVLACERTRIRRKSNPSGVREIQRLSQMMAIVVILYYISWLPILISNIVTLVTDRKSSKLVVLLTGMVSLIYALANPIIYGKMSMRYRWAYKRVFAALCTLCGVCGEKPRSWSISSKSAGTSRSRASTMPYIFKQQESNENAINDEGSGDDQTTAHGQAEGTSEAQTNDLIEGSDDITDGVIVDFCDERNSVSDVEFTTKKTDNHYF